MKSETKKTFNPKTLPPQNNQCKSSNNLEDPHPIWQLPFFSNSTLERVYNFKQVHLCMKK
jgi:hypothetical protein